MGEFTNSLVALLEEAVEDFNVGLPITLAWVARVEKLLAKQ